MDHNTANLQTALIWLKTLVAGRLGVVLGKREGFELPPLDFYHQDSWLAGFLASISCGWNRCRTASRR